MTVGTRLYTFFRGAPVGEDAFGNVYYREKNPKGARPKRWVVYKGRAEPSKVPPEWHGWLHYTHDMPPSRKPPRHHEWEKPHQPNLTGTRGAYVPPGHLLAEGEHAPTTSDYEPWKP